MSQIIAFAGTISKQSINKQLVKYTASLLKNKSFEVLDLNDYDLPIFSVDYEKKYGFPQAANDFDRKISESSGIILSLAEHNGSYTAAFKNLFDWLSRIESKFWRKKPVLLMSTSPGGRGGKGVLEAAVNRFPKHDANITGVFSLPNFNDNFKDGRIINELKNQELKEAAFRFEDSI